MEIQPQDVADESPISAWVYLLGYGDYDGSSKIHLSHPTLNLDQEAFERLVTDTATTIAKREIANCTPQRLPYLYLHVSWEELHRLVADELVRNHGFSHLRIRASTFVDGPPSLDEPDDPRHDATSITRLIRDAIAPLLEECGAIEATRKRNEQFLNV